MQPASARHGAAVAERRAHRAERRARRLRCADSRAFDHAERRAFDHAERRAFDHAERRADRAAAGHARGERPLSATKFADELKKLGFDGKKALPDLEKMDIKAKKKLMPLFQKALGYEACTGCHAAEGDYDTTTRNMKITRKMWSQFVAAVRDDKGGLVFCDSCHNGGTKILNRLDRKSVGKFMHENYVDKLARADKQDNGCAACHGSPLEPSIIEKRWGIAAK